LHTPALGGQEIVSGHTHATLERSRTQEIVLLVQETPFLKDGTTQPKSGRGSVKSTVRAEYLLPPTVAFTPERVTVGVVGRKGWPRPEQPVAQQRHRKPIAEQARYRWREGSQGACAVKQACPVTLIVPMAERAGDIQEWCVDVMRREPSPRAAGIMRAKEHRRLAPGAAQRYVGAERPQTCALGPRPIALARPPERPPRPVTLVVTANPVTCQGARRPGGTLPPVTVSAV
jgi:hypothetical protein